MQTIVIVLDPTKLKEANADLRYVVPECIEEATEGTVFDNGYDYISQPDGRVLMGIWLGSEDARKDVKCVVSLLENEEFLGQNISCAAKVYISEKENAEIDECELYFS